MDLNKFTVKCQEALQAAQTKAINFNHQEVDGEHLLLVLLEQPDGLIPGLLQRMEVPVDAFRGRLEQELDKKARISGPGSETEAHVKRLLSLSKQKPEISPLPHLLEENVFNIPEHMTQIRNKPRWRIGGIWY